MITFKIAWRNLFRNRRRTAITVCALALNTAVLILSFALMEGMAQQMVRSATRLVTGDAQIHAKGYREERSFYDTIENPEPLLTKAKAAGIAAAPRAYGFGLVSIGSKSAGANFTGVNPVAEKKAFELADEIFEGVFLQNIANKEVVLGKKLAKSLHATIGAEIVAVVQAADGSLGNELFKVKGILRVVGEDIDRGAVFMHQDDFKELFVSGNMIHEIALNGHGMLPEQVVSSLSPVEEKLEILTWRKLMPIVSDMVNMLDAALVLFAMVFLLAAALGVLNTMLMATHDRVREFGVQKALGVTPWRIVRDVSTEAMVLASVASLIGIVLGTALGAYVETVGIDLRNFADVTFGFAGIAWDPIWRGHMTVGHVLTSTAATFLMCVCASLYPAVKAARLDPVQAMTHV